MYKIKFKQLTQEKFKKLDFSAFEEIFKLMLINRHKLFDDEYFRGEKPYIERIYEIIREHCPYFWIFYECEEKSIFSKEKFEKVIGFCYLYDFVPFKNRIFSAFATICFKKSSFGKAAFIGAKNLLEHLFDKVIDHKLKAETYSNNFFVANFLKRLNFSREGVLNKEILINNRLVDTEIWGIINPNSPHLSQK